MSKYYILYVDNKYHEEEKLLKSNGVKTFRAEKYDQFADLPTDKHFIKKKKKPLLVAAYTLPPSINISE